MSQFTVQYRLYYMHTKIVAERAERIVEDYDVDSETILGK